MSQLMRSLLRVLAGVGVLLLLAVGSSVFWQRSMLYYPSHDDVPTLLAVWKKDGADMGFVREVAAPASIWLMLHGNAGQAAERDVTLPLFPADASVYLMEYPGYGSRPGSPTRATIDAAALDAYAELRRRYPGKPIYVLGESLGSGPASYLCTLRQPPDKLFLVVPFDRLADVAAEALPFFPARWLLLDRWDNMAALRQYAGPIEIYGARDDEVIPVHHAQNLARSLPRAKFHLIPGGHNEWAHGAKVRLGAESWELGAGSQ
jgi:uncharacterized protein